MVDTSAVPVDPSNREQARAWDGNEGEYWARHDEHFERAAARYDPVLFQAAAIQPTDHVLDIGCGTGSTTRQAGRMATEGSVLGVDLSSAMLAVARRAAERDGLGNVRFEQGDAQILAFPDAAFDCAISRTGGMFFGDPVAAYGNIARALRPRGRLALLVWQELSRNEWLVAFRNALAAGRDLPTPPSDGPGPFSMSNPDRVESTLGAAGFTDVSVEGRHEPLWFGDRAEDAHTLLSGLMGWMLEGLDEAGRARALDGLRTTLEAHQTGAGVLYDSAAWVVTATRRT